MENLFVAAAITDNIHNIYNNRVKNGVANDSKAKSAKCAHEKCVTIKYQPNVQHKKLVLYETLKLG